MEAGATLDASWIEPYADPSRYVVSIECEQFPEGGSIDFIPAGRQGTNYSTRVTSFNWQDFYDRLGGGAFLEAFKKKLRSEYDYVLIDSRTGVSDTAGVCTIQLPDSLVVFFTYNNQSIDGAYAVASYAAGVRRTTSALRVFPVPTRVDPFEEVRLKRRQRHAWKPPTSSLPMCRKAAAAPTGWGWKSLTHPT